MYVCMLLHNILPKQIQIVDIYVISVLQILICKLCLEV